VAYRSHRDTPWRRFWRYQGQKVAVCLVVLLVMIVVGLLVWFMTDMRFRSRSANLFQEPQCAAPAKAGRADQTGHQVSTAGERPAARWRRRPESRFTGREQV
jgi:hypothetical protein